MSLRVRASGCTIGALDRRRKIGPWDGSRTIWVADDFDAPCPMICSRVLRWHFPNWSAEAQMKYLLDTVVWLWSVGPQTIGDAGLKSCQWRKRSIFRRQFLGIAIKTSWEVSLPEAGQYVPSVGRARHSITPDQSHSLKVYDLPSHHPIPSTDDHRSGNGRRMTSHFGPDFEKYPIDVIWCGRSLRGAGLGSGEELPAPSLDFSKQ